jgi:hypothetical protein
MGSVSPPVAFVWIEKSRLEAAATLGKFREKRSAAESVHGPANRFVDYADLKSG